MKEQFCLCHNSQCVCINRYSGAGDQGCQFTSEAFTGVLKAHCISISMDGRGRALDNIFVEWLWRSVKYEDVYLKGYATVPEVQLGLTEYFMFYNTERTTNHWTTARRT
jgi:transposase InsO family protein